MGEVRKTITGDGYAVGHIDGVGEGPGFRKLRGELGFTAFGANVIVLPPGHTSNRHKHERQEELYFVHRGTIDLLLGDGSTHRLTAGGAARVDADTVRALRNASDAEDAVYLSVGGEGGYVGRDGVLVEE
jgi:uncharacterized cupin superfamily protein